MPNPNELLTLDACLSVLCGLLLAQAVREGSWWARAETDSQFCELEGVASLQQLAASVMGDEEVQDHTALDTPEQSPAATAPAGAQQQHEAQVRTGQSFRNVPVAATTLLSANCI